MGNEQSRLEEGGSVSGGRARSISPLPRDDEYLGDGTDDLRQYPSTMPAGLTMGREPTRSPSPSRLSGSPEARRGKHRPRDHSPGTPPQRFAASQPAWSAHSPVDMEMSASQPELRKKKKKSRRSKGQSPVRKHESRVEDEQDHAPVDIDDGRHYEEAESHISPRPKKKHKRASIHVEEPEHEHEPEPIRDAVDPPESEEERSSGNNNNNKKKKKKKKQKRKSVSSLMDESVADQEDELLETQKNKRTSRRQDEVTAESPKHSSNHSDVDIPDADLSMVHTAGDEPASQAPPPSAQPLEKRSRRDSVSKALKKRKLSSLDDALEEDTSHLHEEELSVALEPPEYRPTTRPATSAAMQQKSKRVRSGPTAEQNIDVKQEINENGDELHSIPQSEQPEEEELLVAKEPPSSPESHRADLEEDINGIVGKEPSPELDDMSVAGSVVEQAHHSDREASVRKEEEEEEEGEEDAGSNRSEDEDAGIGNDGDDAASDQSEEREASVDREEEDDALSQSADREASAAREEEDTASNQSGGEAIVKQQDDDDSSQSADGEEQADEDADEAASNQSEELVSAAVALLDDTDNALPVSTPAARPARSPAPRSSTKRKPKQPFFVGQDDQEEREDVVMESEPEREEERQERQESEPQREEEQEEERQEPQQEENTRAFAELPVNVVEHPRQRKRKALQETNDSPVSTEQPKKKRKRAFQKTEDGTGNDESGRSQYRYGPLSEQEQNQVTRALQRFREDEQMEEEQLIKLIHENPLTGGPLHRELWASVQEACPSRPRQKLINWCRQKFHNYTARGTWTKEQDEELSQLVDKHGRKWSYIAGLINRHPSDVRDRWRNYLVCRDRKRSDYWSEDEEERFRKIVEDAIEAIKASQDPAQSDKSPEELINWLKISEAMGFTRSRLQCIDKWKRLRANEVAETKAPTVLPQGKSWRLEKARKDLRRMTVQDKYRLMCAIRDSGVGRETKINWKDIVDRVFDGQYERQALIVAWGRLRQAVPEWEWKTTRDCAKYMCEMYEREGNFGPADLDWPEAKEDDAASQASRRAAKRRKRAKSKAVARDSPEPEGGDAEAEEQARAEGEDGASGSQEHDGESIEVAATREQQAEPETEPEPELGSAQPSPSIDANAARLKRRANNKVYDRRSSLGGQAISDTTPSRGSERTRRESLANGHAGEVPSAKKAKTVVASVVAQQQADDGEISSDMDDMEDIPAQLPKAGQEML
ncbi:putative DNA-binding protein [Thermochaetoides thermophila DSM 1495]|uniref:Putative DNA-binding protein n=1 Tax=Chaetomium thermophilum (strain DSM 1495 / CBS 144.50 / IMI 039719) TaxID=759272 RepID=G0S2C9_CHATD|nr:putative DNA-binding protein [Thermochaetoides thermophila DSM 1495]EGS22162.1 putative DNA-binding protein [Thermochaetoides thermophila DSM 1495]